MGRGGVGGWWCLIGGFRGGKWAVVVGRWVLDGRGGGVDHALGVSLAWGE